MTKRMTGLRNKKFAFQHILPNNVSKQVKQLDRTKSPSGNIPTKIIKDSIDVCVSQLTDCLNTSIYDGSFPKTMKFGDVTPVFNKDLFFIFFYLCIFVQGR